MALSDKIKPISYLKANAAKISLELTESEGPMYITQNGEAKMVVQDVKSFEKTQETLAMLKILALGNQQIESGNIQAADSAFDNLKQELSDR
ncbi:type II toxin-antitoxin system Phd/YefM family antitoxin [Idiomarina sp. UBA4520]|jgi:prevent-host-death family protein|uniref:type II toxin-antitoxin system Phd/YefM family antitoxin n=1 Tax=Idiomarina sp. UBA4520 TaxID=1946647 RepID=UPI000B309B1D|nr:type II toxin-antitoxin system Phd/YefM family antitoxin [Idiomarina sp. UBA4520]MBF37651.1 prevent-host-death protein [Idiomarinaceae bacterium]|tara:strand:- start:684 stop:959 length:276 start_codon:yes stop_codon:yes gene_type:complete